MRQFHFFCKQRYLKYTVLSLLLCPLSSSAAEAWKDVKGESTTNIVESTQQKKQKRVITGVVRDSDTNEPIIGASVWLKNSSVGAVTDIDGKYSITIEGVGGVLEFSYIGMKKQEIAIIDQKSINVTLQPDTEVLDEVVVVGYGSQKKESVVGAISTLDIKKLKVPGASISNVLAGQLSGVVAMTRSGEPGKNSAADFYIRGVSSFKGTSTPLVLVDGIERDLDLVDTDDIASFSILKDASATAIYGSQGANGGVLITTKKGQEGKLQISFSSSSEFSKAYMVPEFQNTYGNKEGMFESWGDKLARPNSYDPKSDFFNTGTNFINSLTLSTGTKQNQTFASVSSTNSKGIVPNNSYDRLNFTIRNTATFLDDKLQLDLGASYVKQEDKNMVSQGQYWNPVISAYLFPRGEDFEDIKTFERYDQSRNIPIQYWPIADATYGSQNPYWTAYRNIATNEKSRYMFNVGLSYKITDWMNLAGRYRMDDTHVQFERKVYATSDQKFAEGKKGLYDYSNYKDRQEYADFMLNINKQFNDFNISANLGYSYSNYWSLARGYKGTLLGVTNLFAASNIDPSNGRISEDGGDSRVRNHAIFANVELGWRSMLYLTLTGRNDWNSRLVNTSEESFFYPSVGLSGIISEMVKLPEFISYLKVRGSYTEVGSPVSQSGLTPGTVTTPIIGGALAPTGIYPFTDFKAERTRSYELGLSVRLWNKLSAEVTYYKSNTYNQTFIGDLPEFSGYKQIYLQAGNVQNHGWEASLGYRDSFGDFSFSSNLTFSRNVNEIKEMVENYRTDMSPEPINVPEVRKDNGRVILKVGGSINDIYANTFLKKDSQGYVEIKQDGSYGLEQGEPVFLGKTSPDFNLGWSNSLSYKGFGLSFLINGRFGGVVTSSTQAILDRFGVSKASAEARDAGGVLLPGQGRVDAQSYYQLIGTGDYTTSGYYVYSATNIRLQELTLSYRFPDLWFKNVLKDVTLSFIANNPWMLYSKAPHDPELTPSVGTYGQGNDYFMQPSVRSFGFGIKFKL